jgi:hypothetical protein
MIRLFKATTTPFLDQKQLDRQTLQALAANPNSKCRSSVGALLH